MGFFFFFNQQNVPKNAASESRVFDLQTFKLYFSISVFFRLHEFDEQVSAVREGMARVVPVPLLSLFTGYELETMVSQWKAARGFSVNFCFFFVLFFFCHSRPLFLCSGVRKPRHPAAPAEVGRHLQGGGADLGAHPVVLGGDGVLLQHGEVALPQVRLGSHAAASHHRRLPGPGLCRAGETSF